MMNGTDGAASTWEKGSRRKKFAGYLKAANELRQSYVNAHPGLDEFGDDSFEEEQNMPGAFPDLKIARTGEEEMVLFPSYSRRHVKRSEVQSAGHEVIAGPGDAEYWKKEWQVFEDTNAIADVDVRGWIYAPQKGPMTRKNRLLFGIARHLSGIPAPATSIATAASSQASSRATSRHRERIDRREEESIEKGAEQIANRGRQEADIAGRGGYSEAPGHGDDRLSVHSVSRTPSPRLGGFSHRPLTDTSLELENEAARRTGPAKGYSWNSVADMSPDELAIANRNLLTRLKPFLSTPAINMPLTIFYYNDQTSQSRTTTTNEAGHFNFRAAVDFVPTHIRVLASPNLSATDEVHITDATGISLISDIDDTIKHSSIGSGAKEIFRNTFVRNLGDLTIDGVKEWYTQMADMGVKLHYVSNSPWQLYPVLVTFFASADLPAGSFHLKQYSGMLQGIFEPVAERKKATLDRILHDFPERRFILVGDSGEADLELYTDIVLANPGRVLAIFIRDVTTAPTQGFFDSSIGPLAGMNDSDRGSRGLSSKTAATEADSSERPRLPPRPKTSTPSMSRDDIDLMTFSDDEPELQASRGKTRDSTSLETAKSSPAPPLPRKPLILRSLSSGPLADTPSSKVSIQRKGPLPPPKPRKYSSAYTPTTILPNLTLSHTTATSSKQAPPEWQGYSAAVRNKVAGAYNAIPAASSYLPTAGSKFPRASPQTSLHASLSTSTATLEELPPPVPTRRNISSFPAAATNYASNRLRSGPTDVTDAGATVSRSKRQELWARRWARATQVLDGRGVVLRAWRVGQDVAAEAVALVEQAEREDMNKSRTNGKDGLDTKN